MLHREGKFSIKTKAQTMAKQEFRLQALEENVRKLSIPIQEWFTNLQE